MSVKIYEMDRTGYIGVVWSGDSGEWAITHAGVDGAYDAAEEFRALMDGIDPVAEAWDPEEDTVDETRAESAALIAAYELDGYDANLTDSKSGGEYWGLEAYSDNYDDPDTVTDHQAAAAFFRAMLEEE